MGKFSPTFIDDLKAQADIVQVVQDSVPLKKAGASYKGLCPFHSEKTPSFHVHGDKGFFHCFGCGTGGDVIKFVELQDKLSFPEAVRHLAERFGISVPESDDPERDAKAEGVREALLKVHELATAYFREQLEQPGGALAREQLHARGIEPSTVERLGLGYAPPGQDGLRRHLTAGGQPMDLLLASGLVVERDSGPPIDRFRNRLIIPICRDRGSVVAFGGRAMRSDQLPKYLNSPETALYTKGRTLYGLNLTKQAIRRLGYGVLVEGYFDFAQALQAGVMPVVATCGTAVTDHQCRLLRRFASKVILSFDPDTAGQTASARSGELLVAEGFQVNVALLSAGEDPDTFVREHGAAAYLSKLKTSQPYLEYVIDRAAGRRDFSRDEQRRAFLNEMLAVAARVPDAATRDQFADRLAHKARIMEDVVRDEIRRTAAARRTTLDERERAPVGSIKPAERGLIWALMRDTREAQAVLAGLEMSDFEGLVTAPILQVALTLSDWPTETVPRTLLDRLAEDEARLVTEIARSPTAAAQVEGCGTELRRRRFERERAALQDEIDQRQRLGTPGALDEIEGLWQRKKDLLQRIEALAR